MDLTNGQVKNVTDATDVQDAVTLNYANLLPITWRNGVQQSIVKQYFASAVVSSGTVTFNLTDDGTSTGNAIFTNVYKESANLWVDDPSIQYQYGTYTLAANKKTLTLNVNKLGSVLIGVIQFVSAANGVTVYLSINGD